MSLTEIYESIIWAIVITFYIAIGYYSTRYIKNKLFKTNVIVNTLIVSCTYSLYYGIALISAGYGDPGFAFPGTVIIAIIFSVMWWVPVNVFLTGVLAPFIFWSLIIFTFLFLRIKLTEKNAGME